MDSSTLEIRYPFALALWDKSGLLWQSIQENWPDITLVHAEPTKTSFRLGKTVLIVELEAARITTIEPDRSLDDFAKMARDFVTAAISYLKIPLLKRIGFRTYYSREFKDREEAAAAFFSLGLVKVPKTKKFEAGDFPVNPQYVLRWESEAKGTLVQLRAETRKLDYEPPAELAEFAKPVHSEKNVIVLDVDYYTVGSAEPGQVDIAEWLRHGLHIVHRDTTFIFGDD